MLRVLKHAGIPLFLHRKSSNHVFTVWQHLVLLLTIRQYEGKSYRMFAAEWLVEAHYLKTFLQLSKIIPHSFHRHAEIRCQNQQRHRAGENNRYFHPTDRLQADIPRYRRVRVQTNQPMRPSTTPKEPS
jgi:hypothetical protein